MSSVNQRIFGHFLFGSSDSTLTDVIVESSRDRIPNSGILDRSCIYSRIHLDEAVPGLRLHELGLECGEAGARGEKVGGHGAVGHQHGEVLSITTQHLCSVYSVF